MEELKAIRGLRDYLNETEQESLVKAREIGCSVSDIAEAIGLTRQGRYHRLRLAYKPREEEARAEETVIPPNSSPSPTNPRVKLDSRIRGLDG